jgi:hypothetical protein
MGHGLAPLIRKNSALYMLQDKGDITASKVPKKKLFKAGHAMPR